MYSGTTMSVVAKSFLLYSTTAISPLASGFAHTSCPPTGVTPMTRAVQVDGSAPAQLVMVWFPLRPPAPKTTTTIKRGVTQNNRGTI